MYKLLEICLFNLDKFLDIKNISKTGQDNFFLVIVPDKTLNGIRGLR